MATKRRNPHACDAWQLLVKFSFTQNSQVSPLAAELELSPAQCHVLRLLEPDKPVAMRQLADGLCCDASNVTGRPIGRNRRAWYAGPRQKRIGVGEGDRADAEGRVRLRAAFMDRMAAPPEGLERLSVREQQTLVRIRFARLLEQPSPAAWHGPADPSDR